MILGVDEVGRGPWAGPLVVGAVVIGGAVIEGLTDSKKLSKKRREKLDIEIREKANGFGLGWVSAREIDEIGLSSALKLATMRAVEQVTATYHEIVIDGTVNFLSESNKGQYVTTIKKADLLVPSVSAASIIAKVARDNYMAVQDDVYPGYGFKRHVGYGTAMHNAAIDKLGVTPLHRLSFAPLHKYTDSKSITLHKSKVSLSIINSEKATTKEIGDTAEDIASEYLVRGGHTIIDRNWKTKYCEIDIVSQKNDTIYFTEVKYRKKTDQGGGLVAITSKKLRQMKFAAEFYALSSQISDMNLRLAVIALNGQPPVIETFLEI
jgi:ribonuclease HII